MRALIIEDDPAISKLLKSRLHAEHFVVDTAQDGIKGSYAARTNEYDIILLDCVLPKKDGLAVCRDIRNSKIATPIVALSVKKDTNHKVEMLDAGIDDYVTKPFHFSELLARIRALLRRPRELEGDILQIADLSIDRVRHFVMRGKKAVYLARKEYMLLEYLARHRGRVLSRGSILEHVWDAEINPFSNTVEAHIRNLRIKIDKRQKIKLIHTVSGIGYKLDDSLV